MFKPLSRNDIAEIVKLQFIYLKKLLSKQEITFDVSDKVVEHISNEGFDPQFGARPIKRLIQREVLNLISKAILESKIEPKTHILIDFKDNQIVFKTLNEQKRTD